MKNLAIGTDVGGSHVCSAIVDLDAGQIVGQHIQTDIDHNSPADDLFNAWAENIRACLSQSETPITRIGMDFPGPFDYARGISQMDHKLPHIKGLSVADELTKRLGPGLEFRFVNDASAFALGESHFGAAQGASRAIVLAIGTGLGSGFIADHRVVEDGPTVPPGGEVWNLPWADSIGDDHFSTRGITSRYERLTGETVKGAKDVADRYESDPAARQTWHDFGRELAQFTLPLLAPFSCHTLLLGGNIARSLPLFAPQMQEVFEQAATTELAGLPAIEIKPCALLSDAAIMGAASLYI